ncbi:hypothetical protein LZ554_005915 [Drepanopeziza brunnea f. sp. 'monogermtubi']|nr:hypothetical protein LZ554_005915 [Drepanopeziza brunnea f. sp. 'monogermtubi']
MRPRYPSDCVPPPPNIPPTELLVDIWSDNLLDDRFNDIDWPPLVPEIAHLQVVPESRVTPEARIPSSTSINQIVDAIAGVNLDGEGTLDYTAKSDPNAPRMALAPSLPRSFHLPPIEPPNNLSRFALLPEKVRHQIWEISSHKPQMIIVLGKTRDLDSSNRLYVHRIRTKPPGTWFACRESRAIALQRLIPCFSKYMLRPVAFNPELDTLLLGKNALNLFTTHDPRKRCKDKVLRHLAVCPPTIEYPGRGFSNDTRDAITLLVEAIIQFDNLKELTLIRESLNPVPDHVWPRYIMANRRFQRWVARGRLTSKKYGCRFSIMSLAEFEAHVNGRPMV